MSDRLLLRGYYIQFGLLFLLALTEVIAAAPMAPNVAPTAVASQSTTYLGADASRAIDGNTDGDWGVQSLTHTDFTSDNWFELNWDELRKMEQIVLYNRTDCCGEKLSNFRVSVWNGPIEVYGSDHFTGAGTHAGQTFSLSGMNGLIGDRVRIELLGDNSLGDRVLSLAEVQVYGYAPPVAEDNSGIIAEDAATGSAVVTVVATDADVGDTLGFAITVGNTGHIFAIDNSGNITTAAALDYETLNNYSLTVTVTDSHGLTDTAVVSITITEVNKAPSLVDVTAAGAMATTGYIDSIAGTATDPNDGDTFSYSKVSGPGWLNVATDGSLSGTPAIGDAGTNVWTVRVTDSGGLTADASLTIEVTTAVVPPAAPSNPSVSHVATEVVLAPALSWDAVNGANSYNVYFGTTAPGALQGNQVGTGFKPDNLEPDTTYYWRVDSVNSSGTTTGSVWSFTTRASGPVDAEGSPLITKLGTVQLHVVEATVFLFKGKIYRFEWVRPVNPDSLLLGTSYFRIIDYETESIVTQPFAQGYVFGSAYVENDTIYVTGTSSEAGGTGRRIRMFTTMALSTDLVNDQVVWNEYDILDLAGHEIFNTSICKTDTDYVLMYEVGAPVSEAGVRFTARFARSTDLVSWVLTPATNVYAKDRYTAPHCLRYHDGWYYNFYLESLPNQIYNQRVVRSRDLITWMTSPFSFVLVASDEDRAILNPNFGQAEIDIVNTAINKNNSDIDFVEFEGKLIINYSWGDQHGGIPAIGEAIYEGTEAEFLRGWFPDGDGSLISNTSVATQSTTIFNAGANRAIDGNTDGNWNNGSVTHTDDTSDNWLELTWVELQNVDKVVLYNRTETPSLMDRLSNFRISVWNGSTEVYGSNHFTTSASSAGSVFTLPAIGGVVGNKVRIELLGLNNHGDKVLSLAEVQVFGAAVDSDGDNLNDSWEKLHFNDDLTATDNGVLSDFDKDGYSAFQEMVFGMDPNVNDSNDTPQQSEIVNDNGMDKVQFKFRRPQNWATLNVTYQLQSSVNLNEGAAVGDWVDNAAIPVITTEGENEWLTYLLSLPGGTETRTFYRCKVMPKAP